MHWNIICYNQDYDYTSDEVSYSFSSAELAEEARLILSTVYSFVQVSKVEFDKYDAPHKIWTCRKSLSTGHFIETCANTYSNELSESYYKSDKVFNLYGEICEHSLISAENAKEKCIDSYNFMSSIRTKVHGPYKDMWWVLNSELDENLIYKYSDMLVDGKTGKSTPIKKASILDGLSPFGFYPAKWDYLDIKVSG